jgi:hypothetical protein
MRLVKPEDAITDDVTEEPGGEEVPELPAVEYETQERFGLGEQALDVAVSTHAGLIVDLWDRVNYLEDRVDELEAELDP